MKKGCSCRFENAGCTDLNTKVQVDWQGDLTIEYEDMGECLMDSYKINYCPICGKKLEE